MSGNDNNQDSNSPTVLIVDDNLSNLNVLFELLSHSGFEVIVATSGEGAIQKAEMEPPDLILLDILMPHGIDGFETCRYFKKSPITRNVPIIFMSALSDPVDKIAGLELGAVDYVTKPFDKGEVITRVRTQLKIVKLTRELRKQSALLFAREIHDSLGHKLTDLDMKLSLMQKLRFQDVERLFQSIDVAKTLVGQCIEDVSKALRQIRESSHQSDFNLNQALADLMEELKHNSTIEVDWDVDLPELPLHKSYQIYYIIKEGIINIRKHAYASQVNLLGYLASEGAVLVLKDNGSGFDIKKKHLGFGLQGMLERSQVIGGDLQIKTAIAQGTQIQIIIPL